MTEYKINENIRANEVVLITNTGEKLGTLSLEHAISEAYSAGFDLVCINENANPVICKMMDYSKYKYDAAKREKQNKAKQHEIETKEIQLTPLIASHDIEVKLKKCREELQKGNRVRIVMTFSGRQISHPEIGRTILEQFKTKLDEFSSVYKDVVVDGRKMQCILAPKK